MADVNNIFKTIILAQLFFAVVMTGYTNIVPTDAIDVIDPFTDLAEKTDAEDINSQVQSNLERQTDLPVVELGALVFFSGNILLDFILNFAFALPAMLQLLINSVLMLINVPSQVATVLVTFVGVAVSVLYFISIINFVVGLRSGRIVS